MKEFGSLFKNDKEAMKCFMEKIEAEKLFVSCMGDDRIKQNLYKSL